MEQSVAREPHKLKVVGSRPTAATNTGTDKALARECGCSSATQAGVGSEWSLTCVGSSMARITAFQAEDGGSTPPRRSQKCNKGLIGFDCVNRTVACWPSWAETLNSSKKINDESFDVVAEAEAILAEANLALV